MYTRDVMDHFANPRNVGELKDPAGIGEVKNPVCGDTVRIYLAVADDVITDVKFKTYGCVGAIACSSICTELVKGRTVTEALAIDRDLIADGLGGLPAFKMKCSDLTVAALKAALQDYLANDTKGPKEPENLAK
ncbi:MAG: iron-sulfur cluster assembly scaffold protein [Heliobacteriaceae bacterium]|nr:iron-sulfur cluster assembly scaffold protein [Heliobacteriaceae bacterium]MDD4588271.1 iron-sulfur cluster assembly scaffold protein [Heliobacteriaceae bacterium]